MATNQQLVDGSLSLDQQQQSLQFFEQVSFAKLIDYTKSGSNSNGGPPANQATFQDVPFGQQPPPIQLQAAKDDNDAASIMAAQVKAGKTIVFHATVFVGGKETIVIGFR